jgi:hypothetical protein
MIIGGLVCIIHAFFPFLFQKTVAQMEKKYQNFYLQKTKLKE